MTTASRPLLSEIVRLSEIGLASNRPAPTGVRLTDEVHALEARPTVRITLEIGCGPGDAARAERIYGSLSGKRGPLHLTLSEVTPESLYFAAVANVALRSKLTEIDRLLAGTDPEHVIDRISLQSRRDQVSAELAAINTSANPEQPAPTWLEYLTGNFGQ